ncbi:PREDICTED: T-cell leukemia/lymphoma protein 1A [Chrysochloris asiatica]|uniref:T-cell leukemia/lymphoma protein 1A n=1 Tax=Chrysochloris asiatica TaxID=185453 RepID=A0A9B0T9Y5_CHRAS|nr:PREDICTED: T-cell leukemia/lymphoma protein 1A [Chrysochloris asiatica]
MPGAPPPYAAPPFTPPTIPSSWPPPGNTASMGEIQFEGLQLLTHPDRLWIWQKNVYTDENQRTWMSITVENDGVLFVLMQQVDVALGPALRPSQIPPSQLPLLWQFYPDERRYRGSDSSKWHVVYHVKYNGQEDMLLQRLPEPKQE